MDTTEVANSNVNTAQLTTSQLPTFVTQPSSNNLNKTGQVTSPLNDHHRAEGIQHVTSSGASIMVIQQPTIPSAVGLVPASVSQGSVAGAGGVHAGAGDPQQLSSLYTTSTGLPAEYVMPGTNMLSSAAAQGFQVHVPVLQQQESSNEENATFQDEDDARADRDELREQDRFLPIANVARIMKKGIPKQGKIAKDAKECVQECVSEFISFITSEASERCQQEKRKTINGEDILFAMSTLGFDNYVDPLKLYLTKYREAVKGEKGSLNSSTENPRTDAEQTVVEESSETNKQLPQQIQFQVAGPAALHPSMVSGDVPSSAIYTYPAQLQNQTLHFQ
eukprot:gene6069-6771_t